MKCRHVLWIALVLLPLLSAAGGNDTILHHILVRFSYRPSIFPGAWQKKPIRARAKPVAESEKDRSIRVTLSAMEKYPTDVLTLNLHAVYWLRKMTFYKVEFGGTNSNNALYLTNDGDQLGYSNHYLEQTFHHEFSSILLRNYAAFFDTLAWKSANAPGFDYNDPEEGVGAIRNHASSQDIDTALCRLGLLTEYSRSSIENDVNTFAQYLFAAPAGFWDLVNRFPPIRQKARQLVDFYKKINPSFTEQYFRSLASQ